MYRFIPQLGCNLVTTFQKSKSGNGCEYILVRNSTEKQLFIFVLLGVVIVVLSSKWGRN
jgi:hypothetical protein